MFFPHLASASPANELQLFVVDLRVRISQRSLDLSTTHLLGAFSRQLSDFGVNVSVHAYKGTFIVTNHTGNKRHFVNRIIQVKTPHFSHFYYKSSGRVAKAIKAAIRLQARLQPPPRRGWFLPLPSPCSGHSQRSQSEKSQQAVTFW